MVFIEELLSGCYCYFGGVRESALSGTNFRKWITGIMILGAVPSIFPHPPSIEFSTWRWDHIPYIHKTIRFHLTMNPG